MKVTILSEQYRYLTKQFNYSALYISNARTLGVGEMLLFYFLSAYFSPFYLLYNVIILFLILDMFFRVFLYVLLFFFFIGNRKNVAYFFSVLEVACVNSRIAHLECVRLCYNSNIYCQNIAKNYLCFSIQFIF